MGVLGLWQILESVGHPIKLEGLEGKRLGVDANIWLYKFIRGFKEKDNASSIDSHKLGLYNRISKLLFYKIRPIFVFDGPAPVLKRRTLERRQNVRSKNLAKVQEAALKLFAEKLKGQYPGVNIDNIRISLPELRSHSLVAAEKFNDEDRDLFYLPPVTEEVDDEIKPNTAELENTVYHVDSSDDEDIKPDMKPSVDIHSKEFANLPAELRYEMLQDIKESRRRIRHVNTLPEDANSFSNLQLERLRNRRVIQEKIEQCERDICSAWTGECGGQTVQSFRMQSDSTSTMLYMHNKPTEPDSQDEIKPSTAEHEKTINLVDSSDDDDTEPGLKPPVDLHSEKLANLPTEVSHEMSQDKEESRQRIQPAHTLPENRSRVQSSAFPRMLYVQNKSPEPDAPNSLEPCALSSPEPDTPNSPELEVPNSPIPSALGSPKPGALNSPEPEAPNSPEPGALNSSEPVATNSPEPEAPNSPEPGVLNSPESDAPNSPEIVAHQFPIERLDEQHTNDDQDIIHLSPETREFDTTVYLISSSDDDDDDDVAPAMKPPVDMHSEDIPNLHAEVSQGMSQDNEESRRRPIQRAHTSPEDTSSMQSDATSSMPQSQSEPSKSWSNKVTSRIVDEAKELLRLFGIPYIDAEGEAEAQCALLEKLNLTEGTITDDSDVWLFGAKNVYRYFFSDDKYVMQYKMSDIEFHIRMTRENLVCFAMMVGSDYTDGIMNIGPVTALEVLSEFPGDNMEPLIKFRNWKSKYESSKDRIPGSKKREKLLKYRLPEDFPSKTVYDGYMRPAVDSSSEKFTWGIPELDELREYARRNFGWNIKKIDEKLLPVMKRLSERKSQPTIDSFFFKTAANQNPELFRSKRVNQALSKMAKTAGHKGEPDDGQVVLTDDDEDSDKSASNNTNCGPGRVATTAKRGKKTTSRGGRKGSSSRRDAKTDSTKTSEPPLVTGDDANATRKRRKVKSK